MFKAFVLLFFLFFGVVHATDLQYIRSFDLGGGGLKTALLSYDPFLNTLEFVEHQTQLGRCPDDCEVADWIRNQMNSKLYKNLDDEISQGYWFSFSLASLERLRSRPFQTTDIASLFNLPRARVRAIDDGTAHLVSSIHLMQRQEAQVLGPVWNFAIGTGVGFGFTDGFGRVRRLPELCAFFDSFPWRSQEPTTGKEVWIACGSKLGFDSLVASREGVIDDAVFAEFALRWKAFIDSCLLRCAQKQERPPVAVFFTGGHIELHGPRLIKALKSHGCSLPLYTGMKSSGLLGAAWNVVSQIARNSLDVNEADGCGNIQLLSACREGNVYGAKALLKAGAEVNAFDFSHRTALLIAVQADNFEMVELLLGCGANVSIADCWGELPLTCALHKGNQKMVELLWRHGA